MTRLSRLVFVLALLMVATTNPVSASHGGRSNGACSIAVADHLGGPTSAFRIRGEGWPAGTMERLTIVEIHIRHVGTDSGSIAWLWLVPGGTWFYYDYNAPIEPGAPDTVLSPGLYRVRAQAEGHRCVARDSFIVRSFDVQPGVA